MSSNIVEDETQQNQEDTTSEEFPSYDPECLTHAYQELLPPKCQKNSDQSYLSQPSVCSEVNPLSNNKLIPPCDRLQNEGLCHVTDSQKDAINSVGKCDDYCNTFSEDYNENKSIMCDSCNCYRTGSLNSGPEEESIENPQNIESEEDDQQQKDQQQPSLQQRIHEQHSPLAKKDKTRDLDIFRIWMIVLFSIILVITGMAFYQTNN